MSLPSYLRKVGNKFQIESREGFAKLFDICSTNSFTQQLNDADANIRSHAPKVSQGALSNVHGSWYEWILAHSFWNYFVTEDHSYLAAKLPNVTSFDVAELFRPKLRDYIYDLRSKVLEASSVELVTSNPDFVIFDVRGSELHTLKQSGAFSAYSPESLTYIDNLYKDLVGFCDFQTIVGFLSVKTSFRPDRRLQIPHEGSLMKAIYAHLVTREWELSPRGIKYYAVACEVKEPDRRALKTVATHSITNVTDRPKAAVDEVFAVNDISDLTNLQNLILFEHA